MLCLKCKKEIPEDAVFCCYCGKKQIKEKNQTKRGNGQGSVYKLPSGTWAAEVTLGYYLKDNVLKRKIRRKKGFKTKKEAVAYLSKLYELPEKQKRITVSELWERFQPQLADLSKSKRCAYNVAWRKIHASIEYRYIDDLIVPELQEVVDEFGTSYYTCRDIKNLLSHLYKLALQDDLAQKNRAQYIRLPSLEKTERETFTDDEINKLWKHYQKTNSLIAAQMLIMLYTGIRPGELLNIQIENVHLEEQFMTGGIKTAKGKARKIIIPDRLVPVVSLCVSTSKRGKLAYYNKSEEFYNAWKELREALSIREELTPYCCRHTFITRLTALKVSPAMLQELAGHEDYETTLEYTHLSVKDRLDEVNRL